MQLDRHYQAPASPSAGRALSVLIAVCAVLWVWWHAPDWYLGHTTSLSGLWQLEYIGRNGWVWFCQVSIGNWLVFRWVTRPMNRLTLAPTVASVCVGSFSILFHVVTLLPWVLVACVWLLLVINQVLL